MSDAPTPTSVTEAAARRSAMLAVFGNLSRYHREHEKYYGDAPLRDATDVAARVVPEMKSTSRCASCGGRPAW
jgi:hypothetical protein